jgi:cellulose synthase/poly-beta-1,6-N-acetylglucosamine synthase-like glycosyltransferase
MSIPDLVLLAFCGLLQIPFLVFWLECWLAFLPRRSRAIATGSEMGEVWVIVPAHNEGTVIGRTLAGLSKTLGPGQRILVVADNCQDRTAEMARDCGCEVIERHNLELRGKGFALQFAYDYLGANHSPAVVVVVDADCRVSSNMISSLSRLAVKENRPVQALNLSQAPSGSGSIHVLSELGFRFKNLVRPLGLDRLGLPCHLMGTGMAIPWALLQASRVEGDALAEDMALGVELALLGHPAVFFSAGHVLSELPQQDANFMSQRTRWEQGHLRTSLAHIPKLLMRGLRLRRLDLIALAFDLMVPPFSLLMLIWAAASFGASGYWLVGGSYVPCLLLAGTGTLTLLTIFCCWWKFCRAQVPFKSVLLLPLYALRKLPIYFSFLCGRGVTQWIRTSREPNQLPR